MKAVVIAGGTPPSIEILREELSEDTILICADSGGDCLFSYNITPDYLIGDFDSIKAEAFSYFSKSNCIIEKYPVEKDDTDTQLALLKALNLGAKTIVFLGCTGTRLDHTFGNFGLLLQCLNQSVHSYIRDDNNTIWLADKSTCITGNKGEYFSILAFSSIVTGLTLQGAKYRLENYNLIQGSGLTLSNEFLDNVVNICFSTGILMITKSFD
jgi:thiamine pyrophosphokinase